MKLHQSIISKLKNPYDNIWFLVNGLIILSTVAFLVTNLWLVSYIPTEQIEGLFWELRDTQTYYSPLESAFQGEGYTSICRMPALAPIYLLLRLVFNVFWTKNVIILIQIGTAIVASVFTGRIAYKLTRSKLAFYFTSIATSSSFILSMYSIVGYMDSMAVSLLIISYYILIVKERSIRNLVIAGLLMAWSIFFRQILGVNLIVVLWIAYTRWQEKNLKEAVKSSILFIIPFFSLLFIWNLYTYKKFNQVPILVLDGNRCWASYPSQQKKVVQLVIAWGGNFTRWNGEAEWFLSNNIPEENFPFGESVMASTYNRDSLIQLRRDLLTSLYGKLSDVEKEVVIDRVTQNAVLYRESYIKERPMNYFVFNRIKLMVKFLVPSQIDGLPLPPFNEMNIIQKGVKFVWWITFVFVNIIGMFGLLFLLIKERSQFLLHLSMMVGFFYLTFWLGYIEQRYLLPYIPFIYIYAGYMVFIITNTIKARKAKALSTTS